MELNHIQLTSLTGFNEELKGCESVAWTMKTWHTHIRTLLVCHCIIMVQQEDTVMYLRSPSCLLTITVAQGDGDGRCNIQGPNTGFWHNSETLFASVPAVALASSVEGGGGFQGSSVDKNMP